MKPYSQQNGVTLFHSDCREIIGTFHYDVIVTDPPYLGRDDLFSTEALMPIMQSLNLQKAFVFWAANFEFPFSYDALHIWHKAIPIHPNSKIGNVAGHHFEKIYAAGFGKKCEVFRDAAIIPNFAACADELTEHPTQKPLSLMRKIIQRIPKGSVIFDPFSGSGSTLVACSELGYQAVGCEQTEKWCSVTVKRLAQPSFYTLPNNRLHSDAGDSPRQQALFTPEANPAEGKLPTPTPRR